MSAVKGTGYTAICSNVRFPVWTRDLPWWHWRYWYGARWRHRDALNYSGVDRTHYATDGQRARQALEEQFDPNHWLHQVQEDRGTAQDKSKGYNYP